MSCRFALLHAAVIAAGVAAGAPSRGAAVEVEPDRIYPAGSRLEAAELGVAFTIPVGWRGAWPSGSEAFVLQPETDPGVYILALGEEATSADLESMMAAPIDLGEGLSLHPTAAVSARGRALAGRYEVRGAPGPLAAYAEAMAGSHGIAVAYVLIAAPDSLRTHEPAVAALVASTVLGAPAAAPPAAPASGAAAGASDRWEDYLRGKYIVRYHTATGYTDEEHLWLCSDGSFRRRSAAGGFGGGASGAFQGDSTGRWTATGAGEDGALTLRYPDGSEGRYELRWDYGENHLYVDGKRWLHGENEVCD